MATKTTRKPRGGDTGTREFFRTERFTRERGLWYFTTREKTLEGPFATRECAEQYLRTHIALTKISGSLEPELLPLEGDRPARPRERGMQTWVLDPYHKRLGTA